MPLSSHSEGTYLETSSHATCQRTFSHSRLSSLIHCGQILAQRVELVSVSLSTLQNKKQNKKGGGALARNEWSNILPKSSQARKKPPPPSTTYYCGFSVRLSRCRVPGVEHLATELTVQRIGQLATNTGQRERAVFFFLPFLFCFVVFLTCCLWNCIVLPLRILGQSKNQWAAGDICCITFVWMWRNMWNTLAVVAALLLKLVVRHQCISACASSTISPSFSNSLLSYCHRRGNLSSASSSWSSSLFVCT